MKLFANSTLLGFTCLFIFLLFSGLDCNDTEDPSPITPEPEKCGVKITDKKWITDFNDNELKQHYSFEEPYYVTFSFSGISQDEVCPHEHIKVSFEVVVKKVENARPIKTKAEVMYGILFNYPIPSDAWVHTEDANYYYAKTIANFGIKSSFGDAAGWYAPFIDIKFESNNGLDTDIVIFKELVHIIKIEWEHYKYKEPASK